MDLLWLLFLVVYIIAQLPSWMTKKALGEYQAGHPARAVLWAKRAIAMRPALPLVRASAHHVAGLGYSEQGRLEEAQAEYQQAFHVSQSTHNPGQAGRSLVLLAGLQNKRGFIADALATARQAAALDASSRRDALVAEADCLRTQGQWEAALEVLTRAQQTAALARPLYERRSQATLLLGRAWTRAQAAQATGDRGAAEQAWADLEAGAETFEDDRKTHLWCEATASWIEALRGNKAEAWRVLPLVQAQLDDFSQSRATMLIVLSMLARAALLLGDGSLGVQL